MLKPDQLAPAIAFRLIDGSLFTLGDPKPPTLTLLAFYRGAFCSFCRRFLRELDALGKEFERRGVIPVAASMDDAPTASDMTSELALATLRIGHGLTLQDARAYQLFGSCVERDGLTSAFTEPALFLIRPDQRIYAVIQNSVSCGRPDLRSLIEGIDMLAAHGFPTRGNAF